MAVDAKTGAAKTSKVVTTKSLSGKDIDNTFGSLLEKMTVETFNKPQNFEKQFKQGKVELDVRSATLSYSSNTQTIKMKFICKSPCKNAYYRDGADY